MPRTIIATLEDVKCSPIRSISALLWGNYLPAQRKSLKSSVLAQVTPLGLPICPERPRNTVTHTGSPDVGYPGAGRSRLIRSKISVSISLVTSTSASWNTNLLAWRTSRPPVLISLV